MLGLTIVDGELVRRNEYRGVVFRRSDFVGG